MQDIVPDEGSVPLHLWADGLEIEQAAFQQLRNTAALPIVFHRGIAVMPDFHWGMGSTVGSVVPTVKAIIPASVGVDVGCGMSAQRTSLTANDLPDNLLTVRNMIEAAVPHGRTNSGKRNYDKGSWHDIPDGTSDVWAAELRVGYEQIMKKHPKLKRANSLNHLGTLGTGNHFIEVCLDEEQRVWVMLHSGSRGIGNAIGSHFIALAHEDMEGRQIVLRDRNLAYLEEGSLHFTDYIEAIGWAQNFAWQNRRLMMTATLDALRRALGRGFQTDEAAVECHHNYAQREEHFGQEVWLTRKGAVSARKGQLGIIPGSMGVKSFIVRGRGNPLSYHSCSHGAGRRMSRSAAKQTFTLQDLREQTDGVECRKDKDVIDEIPGAYKDLDKVMAAQADLVDIVHTLKQVACIKG